VYSQPANLPTTLPPCHCSTLALPVCSPLKCRPQCKLITPIVPSPLQHANFPPPAVTEVTRPTRLEATPLSCFLFRRRRRWRGLCHVRGFCLAWARFEHWIYMFKRVRGAAPPIGRGRSDRLGLIPTPTQDHVFTVVAYVYMHIS